MPVQMGILFFWGIFSASVLKFRVSVSGVEAGRKEGRKGSKEGSKKKAKKRDELGVSHSHFQAFRALQPFLFQIWVFSF